MILALENLIIEMLTLLTNPHATQGRSTLKDKCERQFWNGPFCELKDRIYDEVHEHNLWAIDNTMAKESIVTCCTEANNSVADEC